MAATAFVGAGIVAIGAASAMPNVKVDPATLAAVTNGANTGDSVDRQAAADRANRAQDRSAASPTDQAAQDLWLLPLKHYQVASPFGQADGSVHPGVSLAAPEGTAYYASHGGVVTLARYDGALGYTVMVNIGNGVTLVYGHSAKLLVHEGQQVQAGDPLGLVGDSGYAFGPQLHFEIRVADKPVNPMTYLSQYGLDLTHGTDALTTN